MHSVVAKSWRGVPLSMHRTNPEPLAPDPSDAADDRLREEPDEEQDEEQDEEEEEDNGKDDGDDDGGDDDDGDDGYSE
jgi:hypothetical protein